jgi:hypothetical protein
MGVVFGWTSQDLLHWQWMPYGQFNHGMVRSCPVASFSKESSCKGYRLWTIKIANTGYRLLSAHASRVKLTHLSSLAMKSQAKPLAVNFTLLGMCQN